MSRKGKAAAQVLQSIIAERGIVSVSLPPPPKNRVFFFTAHARKRMLERLGVAWVDLSELKIIKQAVLKANNVKVPLGYFCFGKDDFALICHQQSTNKFLVITVYKINAE